MCKSLLPASCLSYLLLHRPQASSALFFAYNTQLGPPYHVIVDTNFINFSIKNKLDIVKSMMDCLYAKCEAMNISCICCYCIYFILGVPCITDCIVGELEKLGSHFSVALKYVM